MVDLAKIRKKAKKALGGGGESTSTAGAPPAVPAGDSPADTREAAAEAAVPAGEAARVPPEPASNQQPATSNKLERFKQQAGKLREQKIEAIAEQTTEGQLELLTFTISGEHYAVDIERIVEIVTPRPVTRIPNAAASIVGIISLRGTIVTLVDVRRKLRHREAEATADTRIVVIDFQNENVGFVVDRVLRVVKLARNAVEPHPVVHSTELEESIRGVFRVGGALTILLDLDKLLDHSHGPDL